MGVAHPTNNQQLATNNSLFMIDVIRTLHAIEQGDEKVTGELLGRPC